MDAATKTRFLCCSCLSSYPLSSLLYW